MCLHLRREVVFGNIRGKMWSDKVRICEGIDSIYRSQAAYIKGET